jgi:plasmid replication initiation protein
MFGKSAYNMKITNKEVIQSYLITAARYDFSVYEKRIIYRIVEMCQAALEGKKLDKNFQINNLLFDELKEVVMPISSFLNDEKDENYTRAKNALYSLNEKVFEYEDSEVWKPIRIIEMPKLVKKGFVKFVLQKEIYTALLNFAHGFRKFELKTAFEFESVYAMRFYELLSGKTTPITYSLQDLKIMFKLENKYKLTADFIRYVILPAQSELKAKAAFSFEFKTTTEGKKITGFTFYPYAIAANVDSDLETKKLQKRVSPSWYLDKMHRDYLMQNYYFDKDEIRHNLATFKAAADKLDLMRFMADKRRLASTKKNPKGYLINAIKKELAKQ